MKKIYLILAAVFAVMIPVWIFLVLPHVLWRIPPNWQRNVMQIGYMNNPDPETRQWTKDEVMIYEREKKVTERDGSKGEIADTYIIRDPVTGNVTWEYKPKFKVDLKTGINIGGNGTEGTLYVFPVHTQKKTYAISREYFKNLPFKFAGEDEIDGLKTYIFEFKGVAEYTECYQGTDEYPGVRPPEGQEIRSRPSLVIRYWVEPLSGDIVKIEEDCPDGDWIVDVRTGEELAPVLIWGGKSTGDTVVKKSEKARERRQEIILKEKVVPIGFAILVAVFAVAAFRRDKGIPS